MSSQALRDPKPRSAKTRIEPVDAARSVHPPGAMIQDWVGSMFMPGATLAQVQPVLQDYAGYKDIYRPKVIESRQLAGHTDQNHGDEYEVLLRL
jgi:hypothetical protein